MKEKIYTIPVTEAFSTVCECPVCVLEQRLEEEYTNYFLGPSLMEPDCRMNTNEKGFCRRHFEMLYNRQENRLGLGLTIETHMQEQLRKLKEISSARSGGYTKGGTAAFLKSFGGLATGKNTVSGGKLDGALELLSAMEKKCAFCSKLDYTMDRYMDVILYLWFGEESFRKTFDDGKGFCLKHMRELLAAAKKYLDRGRAELFADNLFQLQIGNIERIREEVDWFTKKFDYRNNDKPWGNSKDALPRSIRKLAGNSDLK